MAAVLRGRAARAAGTVLNGRGKLPARLHGLARATAMHVTGGRAGAFPYRLLLQFSSARGLAVLADGRALLAGLSAPELADVLAAIPALAGPDEDDVAAIGRVQALLRSDRAATLAAQGPWAGAPVLDTQLAAAGLRGSSEVRLAVGTARYRDGNPVRLRSADGQLLATTITFVSFGRSRVCARLNTRGNSS